MSDLPSSQSAFLPHEDLQQLVELLLHQGYAVIAPVLRNGVVRLAPVTRADEIASGVRDLQQAGRYEVVPGDGKLQFQYVVGPDSAKRFLFPAVLELYQLHIEGERFKVDRGPEAPPKMAFLGIRPCDVAAVARLDRALAYDASHKMRSDSDSYYARARGESLFIALNCTEPGGTCFCASMGTGPQATAGFDLALTELRAGFVVATGSERGRQLLASLPARAPTSAELELAELKMMRARERMHRSIQAQTLKHELERTVEHPIWDEIATRCLSCGNCTMVCPTCFCSTVTDSTELEEPRATRTRRWTSCFTHQFSFTTSGPVRNSIRGRFRHWMRHKHCTWFEQFGSSGCVGCGRCITWCPAGIDITVEARRITEGETAAVAGKAHSEEEL